MSPASSPQPVSFDAPSDLVPVSPNANSVERPTNASGSSSLSRRLLKPLAWAALGVAGAAGVVSAMLTTRFAVDQVTEARERVVSNINDFANDVRDPRRGGLGGEVREVVDRIPEVAEETPMQLVVPGSALGAAVVLGSAYRAAQARNGDAADRRSRHDLAEADRTKRLDEALSVYVQPGEREGDFRVVNGRETGVSDVVVSLVVTQRWIPKERNPDGTLSSSYVVTKDVVNATITQLEAKGSEKLSPSDADFPEPGTYGSVGSRVRDTFPSSPGYQFPSSVDVASEWTSTGNPDVSPVGLSYVDSRTGRRAVVKLESEVGGLDVTEGNGGANLAEPTPAPQAPTLMRTFGAMFR